MSVKDGIILGKRYEVLSKVGAGGMADVYKGRDCMLNRYVAIKVLKKEYGIAAATKPGMHKKAPAKRVPMSKARTSTQETMVFTLEPKSGEEGKGQKKYS